MLGKHSGRHALRDALEELGFKVEGNALNQAFKRFKEIADKKKQVTALDLEAIVSDEMRERAERLRRSTGSRSRPARGASRRPRVGVDAALRRGGRSARPRGDGPVDAIFGAIQQADRHRRASCASTRSRRSPRARTRSAR